MTTELKDMSPEEQRAWIVNLEACAIGAAFRYLKSEEWYSLRAFALHAVDALQCASKYIDERMGDCPLSVHDWSPAPDGDCSDQCESGKEFLCWQKYFENGAHNDN